MIQFSISYLEYFDSIPLSNRQDPRINIFHCLVCRNFDIYSLVYNLCLVFFPLGGSYGFLAMWNAIQFGCLAPLVVRTWFYCLNLWNKLNK